MFKKIFLITFLVFALFLMFVIAQSVDPIQKDHTNNSFIFPDTLAGSFFDIDSLKEIVGDNKGLPQGFELPALLAYSAYPELKDVRIDMVIAQSGAPMESNFELIRLFGPKKQRLYKVLLNDAYNTIYDEILLRSLPFDAQVGILAHELGHVAYYHRLSTFQIAKWGIMYLTSDKFRSSHEKSTDLMPIYHGLGSQIYQYAYYVRYDPSCIDLYQKFGKEFIDKYYLTDVELLQLWKNNAD